MDLAGKTALVTGSTAGTGRAIALRLVTEGASVIITGRKNAERGFFAQTRPTSLAQRFLAPTEIADVVAFLASPMAQAINGAAVRADGGVVKTASNRAARRAPT